MAALPYMQLYIADYLADTMHLSTEEHGAYLLLMFNYWQTGKPIPKSRLAKIARMSNEQWVAVQSVLSEFFEDDGENWIHLRMESDLENIVTSPRGKKLPPGETLSGYKGYVYFMTSPEIDSVKIGYSKNPWARLSEIRRSYGSSIAVVATIKTVDKSESRVHSVLAEFVKDGEWFFKCGCIESLILAVSSGNITTVDDVCNYVASYDSTTNNYDSPTTTTTNKDTDKDKDLKEYKTILVHGEKTASEPGQDFSAADFADYPEADPTPQPEADSDAAARPAQKTPDTGYPAEFEIVWREYPRRAGANPKRSGFSAWHARRREGVSPEVMLDGVRRYVKFIQASGKSGTEFVQRASTFFGPDRNFENPWLPPPAAATTRRVDCVSPVDYDIPDGFRSEL